MMRKIILLFAVFFSTLTMFAQDVELPRALRSGNKPTSENNQNRQRMDFFVGGNVNSNFGQMLSLNLHGGISPTSWFRIGLGPRYEMYFDGKVCHAFGASLFSEFVVANYIVGQIGYEFLNYPSLMTDDLGHPIYDDNGHVIPCRKNVHALALGIGFQSYLSDDISIYAQYLIYPFQSKNDHYLNFLPMFARVGIYYYL